MKKVFLLLAIILLGGAFAQSAKTPPARNPKWAQPVRIEGVPNLHKISDVLYRGAQPTAEGVQQLKKMGIRTIVNLRAGHSDKDLLGDTGLAYEEISLRAWHVKDNDIVRFLKIITDKSRQPVFFHCQHGADRTGTMCAVYRIVTEGWAKEEAIKEMTQGGYGFHSIWTNLVDHIRELDINAVKKALAAAP
jgi:protein tyrosine/serine phosphatase